MQRKLMMALSTACSCLAGVYVMVFILQEKDSEKLVVGCSLFSLMFFYLCLWLTELARTRDERKRKIREHKERRENELREIKS